MRSRAMRGDGVYKRRRIGRRPKFGHVRTNSSAAVPHKLSHHHHSALPDACLVANAEFKIKWSRLLAAKLGVGVTMYNSRWHPAFANAGCNTRSDHCSGLD